MTCHNSVWTHLFGRIKVSIVLTVLTFLFFLTTIAVAEDALPVVPTNELAPTDSLFHKPLSQGIRLVYADNYEQALAIFDSLQAVFPDHPAPYFYKAATYQTWMSSFRFNAYQKELEENVKKAIETGERMLQKKPNDAWLNFYIGAAYGYSAFYKMRKWKWIGAYRDGQKGIDNFRTALDKNPRLYDVYLGLGSYHYWRTARSKFIRVIAFWMRDLRDLGLKQIEFAMKHGRYSREESAYVLATAYYDYEKYPQALAVLDSLAQAESPMIATYLNLRGLLMFQAENWSEVEHMYRQLLTRLDSQAHSSIGYEVECKYRIAKALSEQGQIEEAYRLAAEALDQSEQRQADLELESQFSNFDDIKHDLQDLFDVLVEKIRDVRQAE